MSSMKKNQTSTDVHKCTMSWFLESTPDWILRDNKYMLGCFVVTDVGWYHAMLQLKKAVFPRHGNILHCSADSVFHTTASSTTSFTGSVTGFSVVGRLKSVACHGFFFAS
jgi:hypothetical protein